MEITVQGNSANIEVCSLDSAKVFVKVDEANVKRLLREITRKIDLKEILMMYDPEVVDDTLARMKGIEK